MKHPVGFYTKGKLEVQLCDDLVLNGYSDCYLPSINELNKLYQNIGQGNALALGNVGSFPDADYWSSSEGSGLTGIQSFGLGFQAFTDKFALYRVRAVRDF